jgi:serine protease
VFHEKINQKTEAMKKSLLLSFAIAMASFGLPVQSQNTPFKTKPGQTVINEPMDPEMASQYVQGEITVKLKAGVGEFGKQNGMVRFGIQTLDEKAAQFEVYQLDKRFKYNPARLRADLPDLSRIYKISFPDKFSLDEVVASFSTDPNVEYAEPIGIGHAADVPNDSLYSQCQHLAQIFAPQAWDIHKGEAGTDDIVIAINDTGVDWDHVDLQSNIWQNLLEDADGDGRTMEFNGTQWVLDPGDLNGIDNDGNGHIDDLIGWNFIGNNGNPNPYPANPLAFHGTHCAGIAGGVTNNGKGIASISYNLTIMPICVDQSNTMPYAWDGMIYAAENGADIISNSWYWNSNSAANQEIVDYVTGLGSIVVACAKNEGNSILGYPASYQHVISVAAVNFDDTRTTYSTYNHAVDISAPGGGSEGGILSTMPGNEYALESGTSMATPMVAGCLGLLKSYHPDWSNDQLINQLVGTADNIDSLNLDYINMLGTGRVNAYRMLTEENVQPFLKLDLTSFNTADANGNEINEPGEIVTLNFDMHNYAPCYGADNVNFSLTTNDPDIAVINGTGTINIPPDSSFSILNQLQVQVSANASCHFADLALHFESDLQITMGQDIDLKLLVNPSGIFVFEGKENGQDYSGTFIAAFLDHLGYNYTYSNTYLSLKGFETVFLSNGNSGQNLDKGTPFTQDNSTAVQHYLESGGKLYVEMGGMFYKMYNANYPNKVVLKHLFGVNLLTTSNAENPIDTLLGVSGTPTIGMFFDGSDQLINWHIDKMTPESTAMIPFFEQGYGNIAIMNDGSATYGQKAFYMGYSLAELHDRNVTSSRYNILLKTMEFFGYSLPQGYILSNFIADKKIGGVGLEVHFTDISISDPAYTVNSWQWDFNNDGSIDSYDQNPVWLFDNAGVHSVRLITSNGLKSDTLVKEGFITVNAGILVYENEAGGIDFSGSFIRDYIQGRGYPLTYTNNFPESLEGYSAAFISTGNAGSTWDYLDDHMTKIVTDYIEGGGYVYLEGSTIFGYYQANNALLFELFGLESAAYSLMAIPIDSLGGQPDALTNDMLFTGNSQASNQFIDKYEPSPGAIAAFVESNYGTVAVQKSVPGSHRTFCFSYALADLTDGETLNTREELLNRILNFFDIYTDVPVAIQPNAISCRLYPNPVSNNATFKYELTQDGQVTLELFNSTGQKISQPADGFQSKGEHSVQWNAEGMPAGIYYYSLSSGKLVQTGKIIVMK